MNEYLKLQNKTKTRSSALVSKSKQQKKTNKTKRNVTNHFKADVEIERSQRVWLLGKFGVMLFLNLFFL